MTDKNRLSIIYPKISLEWDYDKNKDTPYDVSFGSHEKRWWKCSMGHSYSSSPNTRTNGEGKGCKQCSTSKGEDEISYFLKNKNTFYDPEHLFLDCRNKLPLPFDFYLPNYNLCIEYHGEQHYKEHKFFIRCGGLKGLQERDKIKENYCRNNNINLLIIPYWEFENIEKILQETLSKLERSTT